MKKISYAVFVFMMFTLNVYAEVRYVPPQGFEDYLTPDVQLTPLSPKHTGLTSVPVPVLYFFTAVTGKDVQLTISELTAAEPLLKTTLKAPHKQGIYGFGLADYKVELKQNVEYEWTLRIKNESADIAGTGAIKFVPMAKALIGKIDNVKNEDLHKFYADNGYWYDAVDCVSIMVSRESAKKEK